MVVAAQVAYVVGGSMATVAPMRWWWIVLLYGDGAVEQFTTTALLHAPCPKPTESAPPITPKFAEVIRIQTDAQEAVAHNRPTHSS